MVKTDRDKFDDSNTAMAGRQNDMELSESSSCACDRHDVMRAKIDRSIDGSVRSVLQVMSSAERYIVHRCAPYRLQSKDERE